MVLRFDPDGGTRVVRTGGQGLEELTAITRQGNNLVVGGSYTLAFDFLNVHLPPPQGVDGFVLKLVPAP